VISLRQYTGKRLVSFLRQGDFAHAGEESAIIKVMSHFPKNKNQTILDAGCGLGGTADYIQRNGWGQVSGFDIEPETINYAKKKYTTIDFYVSDVMNAHKVIGHSYDIICLFNSFYAFSDQLSALKSLYKLAKPNGQMAIFDYSDLEKDQQNPLFRQGDKNTTPFIPIKVSEINQLLATSGWEKTNLIDLNKEYLSWYQDLMDRLIKQEDLVIDKFGPSAFKQAVTTYTQIRDALSNGSLGGCIVYATKQ